MKKIALIDGYGFVFRAYHSLPDLTRNDGTPVGAVFGFTNMIIKILASLDVSHIAIIFDSGGKNFRHELYKEYKANRPPCPENLIPQFAIIRECANALNIATLEKSGFEADDIIATLAKKCYNEDFETLIISSDKDLMQLINDRTKMYDAMKNKIIDSSSVKEKFSVTPDKVLDVLALIGDASDNIPGVKGIGEVSASELINQFGSLEKIYENLENIPQKKRKEYLEKSKNEAFLSKKLASLDENVELKIEIDDLRKKNIEPLKLIDFLAIQGFNSLLAKVKKEFNIVNSDIKNTPNQTDSKNIKYNKITVKNNEDINYIYNLSKDKGTIVIDYITNNDLIEFLTLSPVSPNDEELKIFYIKFDNKIIQKNHIADDLFSSKNTKDSSINIHDFEAIFFDNSIRKVFYDGKKFIRSYKNFLQFNDIKINNFSIIFDDLNLINYLTNPSNTNHFKELITINLNHNFDELNFNKIFDKIHNNDNKENFEYNDNEIEALCFVNLCIFELYAILAPKITEFKLHNSYHKIELPLLNILADIEVNGVNIDLTKLQKLSNEFHIRILELQKEIYALSGTEFNIASSQQLADILFNKLQLKSNAKSKKTHNLSTNVKVLEELAFQGNIIAEKIIEYRKFSKLVSTYCEALPKLVSPITHKIHTTYSNTATITGRLNSTHPNLQNIPNKTIEGKKIKSCFIAKDNAVLISADYSQIELRILAHIAKIPALISAFKDNVDIHVRTASQIFGVAENAVDENMRSKAKAINFGIIYGISAFGLAKQIKSSKAEASNYIESYFSNYNGIKEYMEQTINFAKQNGYVETIIGRRCFIKDINSSNYIIKSEAERQAINAPIQGSCADIIKKAMIGVYNRIQQKQLRSKLIMQIHDELIIETPNDEIDIIKEILQHEMSNAIKLDIDLKIDIAIKKSLE